MLEGTVGTTLPSPLRLATDTVSLETWSWGETEIVCWFQHYRSSYLWKKQMLKANANIMAQGGEGGGCEFLEQIAPSWTSGWWFFPPETIWKSRWSTSLFR